MRLSVFPTIISIVAALAFMFAFMTSGVIFLPTFFNWVGIAALVWLSIFVFGGIIRLGRTHFRTRQPPSEKNKVISQTERRA